MSHVVRRFNSDKVLAVTATPEAAEQFVDDYVTEHGGVLVITEEEMPLPKPKKMPTAAQVAKALMLDAVSVKKGVYTVRKGFFYRHGYNEDKLADRVREIYPQATILDKGEKFVAFRGGDTVAQGSHWWVKFTLPQEAA